MRLSGIPFVPARWHGGTGSVSIFASATIPIQLLVEDLGVAPTDTGVVL